MSERTYRPTPAGREAWESQDAAVPADYRRMLWLLEFQGNAGLMRHMMRSHPRHLVEEWLAEMEELGLVEQTVSGAGEESATLTLDDARLREQAGAAAGALRDTGAWLSLERLRRRRPLGKPPADTVVLVVEDDPDQVALADLRMSMAGYRVRVADSVQGFLQSVFDEGAPDLLMLDVELPDGSGFDVLARMRRHKVLSELPIVLLTVRNDAADIGRGLACGADGYVIKPYTRNLIADVVRRVLGQDAP